jgi:hypothetical protein
MRSAVVTVSIFPSTQLLIHQHCRVFKHHMFMSNCDHFQVAYKKFKLKCMAYWCYKVQLNIFVFHLKVVTSGPKHAVAGNK